MKFTTLRLFLFVALLVGIVSLFGCSKKVFYEEQPVVVQEVANKELPIEVYVLEDIKSGKYEPAAGIYTGAYVQKDHHIKGDLLAYEKLIGQEQTFKVFTYQPNVGISKQDILRCIAQKKTPYIKVLLGTNYDLTPLYQFIFDMRDNYHTPIFIELYPLTERDYNVSSYRETYQRAYEILHKYLSDIVVVWSTDETRVTDMALYYPGSHYVDWVGLNVYIPRYKGGARYFYEGIGKLDYWYKSFQDQKPLLISGLAVSHFSRIDHTYTIEETKDQLKLFYDDVLNDYPRLKGVIYMDVDMAQVSKTGKEDYSLSSQSALTDTMKELSVPLRIHSLLEDEQNKNNCYMKYSVKATLLDGEVYIPQEYMATCFKEVPLKKVKHVEDLTGEVFYSYLDIQKYCISYYKA